MQAQSYSYRRDRHFSQRNDNNKMNFHFECEYTNRREKVRADKIIARNL